MLKALDLLPLSGFCGKSVPFMVLFCHDLL